MKEQTALLICAWILTKTRIEQGLKYQVMNIKISNIDVQLMFKQEYADFNFR
jgi:hypothetical protein